ncbi:MAG: hypothetical protein ACXVPQ_09775, partial [Bacteroidia bacterium]
MKKQLLGCLAVIGAYTSNAQDFLGYSNNNYAGITGVYSNPASIVDGRLRFDLQLAGLDFNFANNYVG